jgi:phenol 2-monooxygenase
VDYEASIIVAKPPEDPDEQNGMVTKSSCKTTPAVQSKQHLAANVKIGMRIPSVKVISQADARPWHFQELLRSNGTWRVVLFAGDIAIPERRREMFSLSECLAGSKSFLCRFTPPKAKYDSVIEVLTVHAGSRTDYTIFDFPEVLRPYDELDGWDYHKIFADNDSYHEGNGHLYENFGIDPRTGCVVVLRPDQYVSYVGPVDDYKSLDAFFASFMVEQIS